MLFNPSAQNRFPFVDCFLRGYSRILETGRAALKSSSLSTCVYSVLAYFHTRITLTRVHRQESQVMWSSSSEDNIESLKVEESLSIGKSLSVDHAKGVLQALSILGLFKFLKKWESLASSILNLLYQKTVSLETIARFVSEKLERNLVGTLSLLFGVLLSSFHTNSLSLKAAWLCWVNLVRLLKVCKGEEEPVVSIAREIETKMFNTSLYYVFFFTIPAASFSKYFEKLPANVVRRRRSSSNGYLAGAHA